MQKIKSSVLKAWMDASLSNKQLDFLLFIANFQDDSGHITAIHYRELIQSSRMVKSTFYECLRQLSQKGLIHVAHQEDSSDYNIQIIGNDFTNYNYKTGEGYVTVHDDLFYNPLFHKLKANEKLLMMDLMRSIRSNKGLRTISKRNLYIKYMQQFGVKERTLRDYLLHLKPFLFIRKSGKNYLLSLKEGVTSQIQQRDLSETQLYHQRLAKVLCRRFRMHPKDSNAIRDIATVMIQYRERLSKKGYSTFDAFSRVFREFLKLGKEVVSGAFVNKTLSTLYSL